MLLKYTTSSKLLIATVAGAVIVIVNLHQVPTYAGLRTVILLDHTSVGTPALNTYGDTTFNYYRFSGSVLSELSGTLRLITREGVRPPGEDPGVSFGNLTTTFPKISDAGVTVFYAKVQGPVGIANDGGIWQRGSGGVELIVRENHQVPGLPSGTVFLDYSYLPGFEGMGFASFRSNSAGQVAFQTRYSGTVFGSGVWSNVGGPLSPVATTGDDAPGTPSDVTFSAFRNSPSINDRGELAFIAHISGPNVDIDNSSGIWSQGSGELALVARTGDPAHGTSGELLFSGFGRLATTTVSLNKLGATAFYAELVGPGVMETNDSGIWSEASGVLAPVVLEGDGAPGPFTSAEFDALFDPFIHTNGEVTFAATITGDGLDSSTDSGIGSGGAGRLRLVAGEGQNAPGVPSGVFSKFADQSRGSSFSTNANGQVAFRNTLIGVSGVLGRPSDGIWAEDRNGALRLVAREGDLLEVAPGDFRTVATLGILGSRVAFNDFGHLAFRASFTDGTAGVFVSDLAAIPEPSTLALLVLAASAVCSMRAVRAVAT